MSPPPREATLEPSEPATSPWLRLRVAIYPVALLFGALAVSVPPGAGQIVAFLTFVFLMLLPLELKFRAGGGLAAALRRLFESRMHVTREGVLFAGLTVFFGIAAINTGTNLLYLILAMLLSLMIVARLLAELNVRGLRISRRLPPYVFAGEQFRVRITVANPRRRTPAFALEVREKSGPFGESGKMAPGPPLYAFQLDPGERRSLIYEGRIERRGVYRLEGFRVTTRFPFGFLLLSAEARLPCELVVYPSPRELRPEVVRVIGSPAGASRRRPASAAPDEFRALREYRPGDNPRWIHWRSSARLGALLVREFEPREAKQAAVVVDTDLGGRPGEKPRRAVQPAEKAGFALDRAATLAASLLEQLARQGERPELVTTLGGKLSRHEGIGEARGMAAALDSLARLAPGDDPEFDLVLAALRPIVRRGGRAYVLTGRDMTLVRRALERAGLACGDPTPWERGPAAARAVEILSFATEKDVARLYAAVPADGGARSHGGAAALPAAPKSTRAASGPAK